MPDALEARVRALLDTMTLEEKIGQLRLVQSAEGHVPEDLRTAIREGRIGGVLNEVDPGVVAELQRTAREESRLGVPLLMGRDVIHGFSTVFPIPLGQAATWNPDLVEACARASAVEASARGVNWTFAPGLDVCRDPRWGRIAETFGESTFLTTALGLAVLKGFQNEDLSAPTALAACAKHFVGYGAVEGGRDYNSTNIPPRELRGVHLPPFRALVDAGLASIMASFCDLDGIPATAHGGLLQDLLRDAWGFDGLVVSDWNAVPELTTHGLTGSDREAAREAMNAGVDMEMASTTYAEHLKGLIVSGEVSEDRLDAAAGNVLRLKIRLGLLDGPEQPEGDLSSQITSPLPEGEGQGEGGEGGDAHDLAHEAALQSLVLLKNDGPVLPLKPEALGTVAVIGPLADDPYEQLGTWIFDGDPDRSVTLLGALQSRLEGHAEVRFARGVETTRSPGHEGFAEAVEAAQNADVAILCLGEESILSGEAHCRAHIDLPGAQPALLEAIAASGTPVVLVVLAGRPLALTASVEHAQAVVFAWHPGTMSGSALADVLLGARSPSGKLPVTFPRTAGQIPIYHDHKRTGRPPTPETVVHMADIEPRAFQTSVGNTSFYLDAGADPLFPFGFGLSYTAFAYSDLQAVPEAVPLGGTVTLQATVTNTGEVEAEEVAQLYVHDPVASVTRPVRELKGFRRVSLKPGESAVVAFALSTDDLTFVGRDLKWTVEPGAFHAGIGGDSTVPLDGRFSVLAEGAG